MRYGNRVNHRRPFRRRCCCDKTWSNNSGATRRSYSAQGICGPPGELAVAGSDSKENIDAPVSSKYPHYRPNTDLCLFVGELSAVKAEIARRCKIADENGKKVGVIDFDGNIDKAAHSFFSELRRLDSSDLDLIFAAGVPEIGMGVAVMDRMKKAAAGNITFV